jgi:hypothetical protein
MVLFWSFLHGVSLLCVVYTTSHGAGRERDVEVPSVEQLSFLGLARAAWAMLDLEQAIQAWYSRLQGLCTMLPRSEDLDHLVLSCSYNRPSPLWPSMANANSGPKFHRLVDHQSKMSAKG